MIHLAIIATVFLLNVLIYTDKGFSAGEAMVLVAPNVTSFALIYCIVLFIIRLRKRARQGPEAR